MADPFAILHQINNYIWNADRLRWEIGVTALTVATEGGEASVVNGFDGASIAVADFLPATIHAAAQAWAVAAVATSSDTLAALVGPMYDGTGAVYTDRKSVV